jgi:hypothetical protein
MVQPPVAEAEAPGVVRVTTSADGMYAAVVEPDRIVVLDLPELAPLAEIGIDGDARTNDVAWVGTPARLLVLSRVGETARLYVVDPRGPTKLGDIELRTTMRIAAASGAYALLAGDAPGSAAIVDVERRELVAQSLATRGTIRAAGAFGDDRFIVSTGGLFEEWDGRTRKPARRVQLSRPAAATHIGGNPRQLWLVREGAPDKIEVIALSSVGRSRVIELPEPAEHVASDVAAETLVVVGARTGGLYVIDLVTRAPLLALDRGRAFDAAWLGSDAIVACTAGGLIELVPATGEAPPPGTAPPGPGTDDDDEDDDEDDGEDGDDEAAPGTGARGSTWARVAAWREQVRRRTVSPAPTDLRTAPSGRRLAANDSGWRDVLAAWARGVLSGGGARTPELDPGPLHDVAARLDLDGELSRALWLAYGAHLCGQDGVAPIDVASVTARRWDEALGAGVLAATGALVWRRSRMRITPELEAALDERPPLTGTLIEGGGAPHDGALAVVAPADAPWDEVAAWAAAGRGRVLAPAKLATRRPRRFALEARLRGAAPLVPWARLGAALGEPPARAIVVVEDDAAAAGLGLDVVARWPGPAGG